MAKPRHEPTEKTRAQALAYAMVGVPHHDITLLIGLKSTHTLLRHYKEELALGKAQANANVAKFLYTTATSGPLNTQKLTAAIFWSKTQMGWRETQLVQNQQLDKNGKPITPQQVIRIVNYAGLGDPVPLHPEVLPTARANGVGHGG